MPSLLSANGWEYGLKVQLGAGTKTVKNPAFVFVKPHAMTEKVMAAILEHYPRGNLWDFRGKTKRSIIAQKT